MNFVIIAPLTLTLDVKKANPGFNSIDVVLGLEDGGAIVSNYEDGLHHAVRIDSQGQDIDTLYTTDKSVTGFIFLPPDELLILQHEGTIVRVQISDGKHIDTFKVNVSYLADGILDDEENLLLVDWNHMEVFNYCMTTKHKKVIVQKDKKMLNWPCSIHKAQSDKGVLYLVASQHRVNIYNSEWCLLSFAGSGTEGREAGDLRFPNSAILTPWNTVWVADGDNDTVKEFSLNGDFLQYIINRSDCINHPLKLSLCGDQLWLSYRVERHVGASFNVNRYEIKQEYRE